MVAEVEGDEALLILNNLLSLNNLLKLQYNLNKWFKANNQSNHNTTPRKLEEELKPL